MGLDRLCLKDTSDAFLNSVPRVLSDLRGCGNCNKSVMEDWALGHAKPIATGSEDYEEYGDGAYNYSSDSDYGV